MERRERKLQVLRTFQSGVVTINLVDVALSSGGDMDKFWKIFDDRLELCYRALMCRHNRLKGTLSDAAPILWQFGALARLKKENRLINFSMEDIQRFLLDMQDFTSV